MPEFVRSIYWPVIQLLGGFFNFLKFKDFGMQFNVQRLLSSLICIGKPK